METRLTVPPGATPEQATLAIFAARMAESDDAFNKALARTNDQTRASLKELGEAHRLAVKELSEVHRDELREMRAEHRLDWNSSNEKWVELMRQVEGIRVERATIERLARSTPPWISLVFTVLASMVSLASLYLLMQRVP